MPIVCTKVKSSRLLDKAKTYGATEFIWARVDETSANSLPFPDHYKFAECFLPKKYMQISERIDNFQVRSDDVWICAFPKTGSTWATNIVHQLQHNLDFTMDIYPPYKLLERSLIFDVNDANKDDAVYRAAIDDIHNDFDEFDGQASPRLLKTHLPAPLLPVDVWRKKPKMIYIYRDAKDTVISMYHMFCNHRLLQYRGTMEDFFDIFLNDRIIFGPFYEHINSYRQLRNQCNHLLLISYEDMVANPFGAIKQISEFLNYAYSDQQLKQLTKHLSFENMRKNFGHPEIYSKNYR